MLLLLLLLLELRVLGSLLFGGLAALALELQLLGALTQEIILFR
ncbi:MAG: hypothetical protein ACRDJM_03395 [Actinomycetota bacterium]